VQHRKVVLLPHGLHQLIARGYLHAAGRLIGGHSRADGGLDRGLLGAQLLQEALEPLHLLSVGSGARVQRATDRYVPPPDGHVLAADGHVGPAVAAFARVRSGTHHLHQQVVGLAPRLA